MSHKLLKRAKLAWPVFLNPGDSINVNYTGEMGGEKVNDKQLIAHRMAEDTEPREFDHVAIYEFENEFEFENGIACVLGSNLQE